MQIKYMQPIVFLPLGSAENVGEREMHNNFRAKAPANCKFSLELEVGTRMCFFYYDHSFFFNYLSSLSGSSTGGYVATWEWICGLGLHFSPANIYSLLILLFSSSLKKIP